MKKLIKLFLIFACVFSTIVTPKYDVYNETTLSDEELLVKYFEGKNFSILGDSISTYFGYSNDATNTNSTIGSNALWFRDTSVITSVNETWWMQVANETNMNVLVNNSWSGSEMLGNGYIRASQLHDNTGENSGTKPDVVAIFMGVNDLNHFTADKLGTFNEDVWEACYTLNDDGTYTYIIPTTFAQAYAIAIHKIQTNYRSEIFCCTMMENQPTINQSKQELLLDYIDVMKSISTYFDCHVVDFYEDSGITADSFSTYTTDSLHPNEAGMDLMTTNFVNEMVEYAKMQEEIDHKAQLLALISESQQINQQYYTESSITALQLVSLSAQNVYTNQSASDTEVLDAIYDLNVALKNLEIIKFIGLDEETLINTEANKNVVKVIDYSSQSTSDLATNSLDYNETTIWHSDWNSDANKVLPHHISYDLGSNYELSDIIFLPRQTGNNGDVFTFNVYLSLDQTFEESDFVGTFEFENNGKSYTDRDWKRMEFETIANGRYVKLESTKTGGNTGLNQFTSFAEVRFYGIETNESNVNKQALIAKINEALTLNADDYTEATFTALTTALSAAQAVNAKEDATQEEVNNATTALAQAMDALETKADETPDLGNLINTEANKDSVNILGFSSQCGADTGISESGGGEAYRILDYDTTTYWHTDWRNHTNETHWISFDLGKTYDLTDIQYMPRQGSSYINGDIFEMKVYVSDDETFEDAELVGNYEYEYSGYNLVSRDFHRAYIGDDVNGRYVKIEVVNSGGDGNRNGQFASMAEIRFYGEEAADQPVVPSVDKDVLVQAIADAKAVDTTKYTEATVTGLTSALAAAESINADENATQEAVDAATKALTDAIDSLEEKPVTQQPDPKPIMDFYDVQDKSAWFYGSVEKAFTKGLMLATGKAPVDGKPWFEPDTNISRGMVATVLYRMAGQPKVEFKATFKDVTNANLWYSTAITWAAQNNVVSGYKDGRFGCDDNITRQDLAIMLRNYAKAAGLDTNVTVDFAAFKDGKQVVDYAASAIAWCVEAKLMSGSQKADGTYLMPTANATRAECAKMFSLLDDAINK